MSEESAREAYFKHYDIIKQDVEAVLKNRDVIIERQIKTRRNLLVSGLLALVIGRTDLVPAKIDALGISFSSVQQTNFRYIVAAVVVYFALVFTYQLLRVQFYEVLYRRYSLDLSDAQLRMFSEQSRNNYRFGSLRFFRGCSIALGRFVEIVIPYLVAVMGVGAVFRAIPDRLFFGVL